MNRTNALKMSDVDSIFGERVPDRGSTAVYIITLCVQNLFVSVIMRVVFDAFHPCCALQPSISVCCAPVCNSRMEIWGKFDF